MVSKLQKAIDAGDITQVREILANRNAHGIPKEDINNVSDNEFIPTGVMYTISRLKGYEAQPTPLPSQVAFEIIESFLSVYSNAGNPVIDLNVKNGLNNNSFDYLISTYADGSMEREHARSLFNRMINLRTANGDRTLNISDKGHTSPLIQAIMAKDEHMVRLLLDLRNRDGSHAIDVNHQVNFGRSKTPLDVAYEGSYIPYVNPNYIPNQEIINILRAAGATRANEVVEHAQPRLNFNREHENPINLGQHNNQEIVNFEHNLQNTHLPPVERSVDLSIVSLKNIYYQNPEYITFEETKKQIEDYIDLMSSGTFFSHEEIQHIRRGFSLVCGNQYNITHIPSGLNTHEILTIIWMGVNDKTRLGAECPASMQTSDYIELRRKALLEKLKSIATTYQIDNNDFIASCIGGTRNLLVDTLNRAHPVVFIAPTEDSLKDNAVEFMKQYCLEKLMELSLEKQKQILKSWSGLVEDNEDENTVDKIFLKQVQQPLFTLLRKQLGSILSPEWIEQYETTFMDFPCPIPTRELRGVMEEINTLQSKDNKMIAALKNQASHIYDDFESSYAEDYKHLQHYYDLYLKAEKLKAMIEKSSVDLKQFLPKIEAISVANEFENIESIERDVVESLTGILVSKIKNANRMDLLDTLTEFKLGKELQDNVIQLLNALKSLDLYSEKLLTKKRINDASKLSFLADDLYYEVTKFLLKQEFTQTSCQALSAACHNQINQCKLSNSNTPKLARIFTNIFKYLARILYVPVAIERLVRKDGLSIFSKKTTREQMVDVFEEKVKKCAPRALSSS